MERDLRGYLELAMHFNEPGTKLPPRAKRALPLKVPADLLQALRANSKARATFAAFVPSRKKEYILWVTGAKTDTTRGRRVETAVGWMAEGKSRSWKYEMSKKK